jgi:hypothetical protein
VRRGKPTRAFLDLRGRLGAVSRMREGRPSRSDERASAAPRKSAGAVFRAPSEAPRGHSAPSGTRHNPGRHKSLVDRGVDTERRGVCHGLYLAERVLSRRSAVRASLGGPIPSMPSIEGVHVDTAEAMVLHDSGDCAMTAVKPLPILASFLLLATPAAVATAGSLQIIPRGTDCVVADRFPRIDALLTPPDQVSLARVLFRTKDSEGWYWVRMDHEGDRFAAVLPKPGKGLKDFRYYIEATDTEFETSQTPEYEPQVVVDPEACKGKMVASTVASAKVIMHVPTGYKVPPVPSGFSVRGTLRAGVEGVGVFPHMSLTTALLAAGVVGAGAVAVGLSVANPPAPVGVLGTLVPVAHGTSELSREQPTSRKHDFAKHWFFGAELARCNGS